MPQSLSAVSIHLVFSTKDRYPFLRDKGLREELHSFLGGVSKTLHCPTLIVGGVEDHVYLLSRFGRTISQAEWVKELKRVSNLWLKEQGVRGFAWQGGYNPFYPNIAEKRANVGVRRNRLAVYRLINRQRLVHQFGLLDLMDGIRPRCRTG